MSYQVLARKWRPRSFADMVGQGHVLQALTNALDTDRLHHAYLFSGTRGVGKTTLARILAKCLNCEQGVSSQPCGECSACVGIDEGRFVDLIEVDAASRAKVEETRELMENVQYAPSMGRYKVYLIDEVHMFSNHSFNALLKTLEEPPPHVKFLLATTEPKKLPITILSRCLQFNLKHLTAEQISAQLTTTIAKENINSEGQSIQLIAQAANGSMRDALSILDQAISYGNGSLAEVQVREMLGTIDSAEISGLLLDLINNDAASLFARIAKMAEHSPDYDAILLEMLSRLQQIAVSQVLGSENDVIEENYREFADKISREDVQLYYQIGLNGRRDLAMAPDSRAGFEMTLIRMLAFRPLEGDGQGNLAGKNLTSGSSSSSVKAQAESTGLNNAGTVKESPPDSPALAVPPQVESTQDTGASALPDTEWQSLIEAMSLRGMLKEFAGHCGLKTNDESKLHLVLMPSQEHLLQTNQKEKLQDAVNKYYEKGKKLVITVEETISETPAQSREREMVETQKHAEESILNDPNVKAMEELFDATVDKDSIRPV